MNLLEHFWISLKKPLYKHKFNCLCLAKQTLDGDTTLEHEKFLDIYIFDGCVSAGISLKILWLSDANKALMNVLESGKLKELEDAFLISEKCIDDKS